jgi:hypothetical protein
MKRITTLIVFAAFVASAWAEGKPPATPAPDPVKVNPIANAGAVSGSVSGAAAGATSSAEGYGLGIGQGGAAGAHAAGVGQGGSASGGHSASDASSYNALSTSINDNAKMYSLAFAPPVWTLVPQANGKCTVSESGAHQVLFGAWAKSGSKQFTDRDCAMAEMSNAYRQACRFRTAANIDKYLFEKFTEGAPGDFFLDGAVDLTPVQCADLMRPRLVLDGRMSQPAPAAAPRVDQFVNVTCPAPVASAPAKRRAVPAVQPKGVEVCK